MKAFLFDMNGVVVEDEHLHNEAFVQIWKEEENIGITPDDLNKLCMGRTDREGMENIAAKYNRPINVDRMNELKRLRYRKLSDGLTPPSGLLELLSKINGKFKIGLVTSALKIEALRVIDLFNIGNYFEIVVTGEDIENGKPHPEPYLKAAKALGVPPRECVVIEDSPTGIKSAKDAGMHCIAIRTKLFTLKQIKKADKIVSNLSKIKPEEYYDK